MRGHAHLTIVDRLRALGLDPSPALSWAVGTRARERWIELYGRPPEKDLRTKTSGRGSHCFAYPYTFRREIDAIARRIAREIDAVRRAQMRLFPEPDEEE